MKFTLEIELGNELIQDWSDIRIVLMHVIQSIRSLENAGDEVDPQTEKMRDINGNTVGKWQVSA